MPATTQVPTGESQPTGSDQAPTKRDLASWWKQFKKNNRKDEVKAQDTAPSSGIFGVPLQESIKYANVAISLIDENGQPFTYGYVPIVVAKCGVYLKEKATNIEGIFRLAGAERRIKELQATFNSPERYGKGLDWTGYTVHDAANILRRYFNQLPEPIIPLNFYDRFRNPLRHHQSQAVGEQDHQEPSEGDFDHDQAIKIYQNLVTELPPLHRQLLLYILDLLAVFASKSETNRMTAPNLAAIFQPGILSHPDHDMAPKEYRLSQDVLIFLIVNQDHFIVGMEGTAADEKTIQEVQSGAQHQRATAAAVAAANSQNRTTQALVNRSASTASAGADSIRKYGGVRRNVSVSSRRSRQSGNSPSPVTPPPDSPYSTSGKSGGLGRSNTLPSRRSGSSSPAVGAGRFQKEKPTEMTSATFVARGPNSPSPLASNTSSTTPDRKFQAGSSQIRNVSTTSTAPSSTERIPSGRMSPHLRPVPTPSARNRSQEGRKPNKLQKKRLDASASLSAQSSTASLGPPSYPSSPGKPSWTGLSAVQQSDAERLQRLEALGPAKDLQEPHELMLDSTSDPRQVSEGSVTPVAGPATTAIPFLSDAARSDPQRPQYGDTQESQDSAHTLRPTRSPTGSYGSNGEGHDFNSSYENVDEFDVAERKEKKHSRWKFSMSKKDKEKEKEQRQLANGNKTTSTLGSSQGAKESTSSVGSEGRPRRSFTDEPSAVASVPTSSDATVTSLGAGGEKKGPLGWFKDRLQEIKERDDAFFEKRAKSPPPTAQRVDASKSTQDLDAALSGGQEAHDIPTATSYNTASQGEAKEEGLAGANLETR